jgi:hypothetical protein
VSPPTPPAARPVNTMRTPLLPIMLLPTLLSACASIHRLLPEGPALSAQQHAELSGPPVPSRVRYTGDPQVDFPVLPVQLWGLHYAIDIVLVSDHPDWSMHEYARIDLPDQRLWIAKDADIDGDQHVVAELDDIESWLPEIPVPRTRAPVITQDDSDPRRVDLRLETVTPHGEAVRLRFEGARPQRPPGKRNGSTMEHSRQAVAAVLDLAGQRHGGSVDLQIGGQARKIERLLGLYGMKFVLDQHQAGFAVASFEQRPAEGGFELERPAPGVSWPTRGLESWSDDGRTVQRADPIVTLSYEMPIAAGTRDARELQGARVEQAGHDIPLLELRLDRALPDLRRRFEGRSTSRFSLDIHGQAGHGTGTLEAWWGPEGPVVEMRPTAPWWLAERPMRTEIRYLEDGSVRVSIARIPVEQAP